MCDCVTGQVVPDTEKGHNAFTFCSILKIKALLSFEMSGNTIPVSHLTRLESSATTVTTSNPVTQAGLVLRQGYVPEKRRAN
jgi:hypothetical protein